MIDTYQILILAIIQGACELLPVSSSAHVIVAKKLMGFDPTSPAMTLLLVMLHTGTMFAVIVFFWKSWKESFFKSREVFFEAVKLLGLATFATGVVGLSLKAIVEKFILKAEIEMLFGNLFAISIALACVGVLIIYAGFKQKPASQEKPAMDLKGALLMGIVQGICLPFRGFSRSGATISTGLLLGINKKKVEDFSFALAVILTPPVIVRQVLRCMEAQAEAVHAHQGGLFAVLMPSLIGMVFSFLAGLVALKWLSSWLEHGRWYLFGFYCLFASSVVLFLHFRGL